MTQRMCIAQITCNIVKHTECQQYYILLKVFAANVYYFEKVCSVLKKIEDFSKQVSTVKNKFLIYLGDSSEISNLSDWFPSMNHTTHEL